MTRIAVVGRGLWGSAAAMHLVEAGHHVALIGPSEPADPKDHAGPHGSHHDAGRITRKIAKDRFWTRVSTASIDRYARLEADSGIRFYEASGGLMCSPDPGYSARVLAAAQAEGVAHETLDHAALAARYPMFRFPAGTAGIADAAGGTIDPRAMRRAHEALAIRAGAEVVDAAATGLTDTGVSLADGRHIAADRILVATGAWAGLDNLLPVRPDMYVAPRTILFVEVEGAQAEALTAMPSLLFEDAGADHYLYLLPPVRYPDGKLRLKIGGEPGLPGLKTPAEAAAWFATDGDTSVAQYLKTALSQLMPDLDLGRATSGSCILALTPSDHPYIARLSDRIAVATGCNGAGAKCADELGRLAAEAVLGADPDPGLALRLAEEPAAG
ncbi:FAD-dependent oxidoreductase [Rhodobacterales bacterium HKCCE3408]|nr:FAD-dependent oxidoreductase [Rhodobacterales bacterium HKCCE3408]